MIDVLHVIDTLAAGGAERMAVNVANALPRTRFRSHLCTTRREGPLAHLVAGDVQRLNLYRTWRFDPRALNELRHYITQNDIRIVHAHSSSIFLAAIALGFRSRPALIWHDHYGGQDVASRSRWIYGPAARRASAVLCASEPLRAWVSGALGVPASRTRYIRNFSTLPPTTALGAELPGRGGARIVCVANLRPQKDHLTLLSAMRGVVRSAPATMLLLVGSSESPAYLHSLEQRILEYGLADNVALLGAREDIGAILRSADIGVLSSASEAMPLALVEYGLAGLAVVSTDVGQCAEVLDGGRAGLLVEPGNAEALAAALTSLVQASPLAREQLGSRLRSHVQASYGSLQTLSDILAVYEEVLE